MFHCLFYLAVEQVMSAWSLNFELNLNLKITLAQDWYFIVLNQTVYTIVRLDANASVVRLSELGSKVLQYLKTWLCLQLAEVLDKYWSIYLQGISSKVASSWASQMTVKTTGIRPHNLLLGIPYSVWYWHWNVPWYLSRSSRLMGCDCIDASVQQHTH